MEPVSESTPTRSLAELESVIERGLTTFVDVGTALAQIRDSRLYRETHGDFDSYCRERWGFSRQRALQMIDAAAISNDLTTQVVIPPSHEKQIRELSRIEPEQRAEVWQAVVDQHGEKPTAQEVRQVVEARRWTPMDFDPPRTGNPAIDYFPMTFGPTAEPIDIEPVDERTARMVSKVLDTDDMAIGRLRVQFFREIKHLYELIQLKPEAIGDVLERDELVVVRMQIADARRWLDALEIAIQPRGIRIVS